MQMMQQRETSFNDYINQLIQINNSLMYTQSGLSRNTYVDTDYLSNNQSFQQNQIYLNRFNSAPIDLQEIYSHKQDNQKKNQFDPQRNDHLFKNQETISFQQKEEALPVPPKEQTSIPKLDTNSKEEIGVINPPNSPKKEQIISPKVETKPQEEKNTLNPNSPKKEQIVFPKVETKSQEETNTLNPNSPKKEQIIFPKVETKSQEETNTLNPPNSPKKEQTVLPKIDPIKNDTINPPNTENPISPKKPHIHINKINQEEERNNKNETKMKLEEILKKEIENPSHPITSSKTEFKTINIAPNITLSTELSPIGKLPKQKVIPHNDNSTKEQNNEYLVEEVKQKINRKNLRISMRISQKLLERKSNNFINFLFLF